MLGMEDLAGTAALSVDNYLGPGSVT